MKNIYENSENFTHSATISAAYYMIGLEMKALEAIKPPTGLDAMIDRATGNNPYHSHYKNIIEIVENTLPSAIFLEDEKCIENLNALKEKLEVYLKFTPLANNIDNTSNN